MTSKQREKEIANLMQDMEKKFGKNVLRKASEIKEVLMKRIPSGVLALDVQIGGGYPMGRFVQLSGGYSTTKSTTIYHAIRESQAMGLNVALILSENGSWTDEYGKSIGINTDELLINECASMEEALEIARQLQERGIAQVIVIDSLEALEPMKEMDSSMEDSVQMGLKPKMFGEYFRKFQAINNRLSREGKTVCTVLGINQLREKIGAYGDPEYEGGGRAIGFTSSLTIRLRRGEWITEGTGANKRVIGQQVRFKVSKSKVSIPQRTGEWEVYIDEGGVVPKGHVDNFKSLVLEAVAYGIIHRGGAWFSYKDLKVQGADKLVATLRDNLELYEEIKEKTMQLALGDISEELDVAIESGELDKLNEIGEEEIYDDDFEVEKKVDLEVKSPAKPKVKPRPKPKRPEKLGKTVTK